MERYHVDGLSFEVPPGYEDQSLNAFVPSRPAAPSSTLTIAREPRGEQTVAEQAEGILAKVARAFSSVKVVARRSRSIGTLPGYEARLEMKQDGVPLYQRVAFVGWYDTFLVFSVTTLRAKRTEGDRLAERWLDAFRFRSRETGSREA
jgi:hypothetical protein